MNIVLEMVVEISVKSERKMVYNVKLFALETVCSVNVLDVGTVLLVLVSDIDIDRIFERVLNP